MLPLLLLLASFLRLPPAAIAAPICSPSKTCGNMTVAFPFELDEPGRPPCGSPSFQLNCSGGQAFLTRSTPGFFQVLQVFIENSSFIAVDHSLPLADGCPVPQFNICPAIGLGPFALSKSNRELLFLTCPRQQRSTPEQFLRTPCGNSSSFFHLGGEYGSQRDPVGFPPAYNLSVVPVLGFPDSGYDYVATMRLGFLLQWTVASNDCSRCEATGGRCMYQNDATEIACFCAGSGVTSDHCATGNGYNKRTIYITAITLSAFLAFMFLAFLLGYKKYRPKRKSKETIRIESILQKNGTKHLKRHTYAQVKRMTKCFAEKLGQGGFGAIYRGDLSDGHPIAVKMLKDYKTDGEGFINEVASISRTSHVNVVTLLGFCLEGSKRALIYEYMPNGSLERYAFKHKSKAENTLSLEKLFDIAVGIARGLEYLHRGCNTRIVHFDIKPHNILLGQGFCPKISDFGLAKLCLNKESAISISGARGTIGYIAPEVYSKQFGVVSSKSDVYSYGMMLLEMVGARDKSFSVNSESSSQYFPEWIYEHLEDYCISASERLMVRSQRL